MGKKLYVGNLSFKTMENDLQDAFASCGEVEAVDLMMDKMTQRPRGFAFVTMVTDEGAEEAIRQWHGKALDGRNLTVNEARPREERPARSGGFGGGGGDRGGYGGGGGGGGGRDDRRGGGRDDRRSSGGGGGGRW